MVHIADMNHTGRHAQAKNRRNGNTTSRTGSAIFVWYKGMYGMVYVYEHVRCSVARHGAWRQMPRRVRARRSSRRSVAPRARSKQQNVGSDSRHRKRVARCYCCQALENAKARNALALARRIEMPEGQRTASGLASRFRIRVKEVVAFVAAAVRWHVAPPTGGQGGAAKVGVSTRRRPATAAALVRRYAQECVGVNTIKDGR